MLDRYEACWTAPCCGRSADRARHYRHFSSLSLASIPLLGQAYFPRTDPGQFVINLKAPAGHAHRDHRRTGRPGRRDHPPGGVPQGSRKSSCPTSASPPASPRSTPPTPRPHTAFVQVGLKDGSPARAATNTWTGCGRGCSASCRKSAPTFNPADWSMPSSTWACPRPSTSRSAASNLEATHAIAARIAAQIRALPGVSDVLIPQDIDYPALQIDIDRDRASELGLNAKGSGRTMSSPH